MEFKDIDAMFENVARRIGEGVNPAAGVGGEPPLASDHFLLKRSWDFFSKRMKALENQWTQIADAKDAEIKAMAKAADESRKRLEELEMKVTEAEQVDRVLDILRLEDRQEHAGAVRGLQEKWETQRENLERRVTDAEDQASRIKKDAAVRLEGLLREGSELRASLEKARAEIDSQMEKRLHGESEAAESMLKRDEVIRSLESKVDLLRSEVDRRELLFKEQSERLQSLSKEHQRQAAELATAKITVQEAALRAGHLEESLRLARQEIETLKAARQREQAEWRELWERGREMWDLEHKRRTDE